MDNTIKKLAIFASGKGTNAQNFISFFSKNKYLKKRKVDVVIANNGYIDTALADKYKTLEQKDAVKYDYKNFKNYDMQVIGDDLVTISNNMIRHNSLKLGFHIFFYVMNN